MSVTVQNPADLVVQAIFLRGHISLMNKGMKHSHLKKGDVIAKINTVLNTNFTSRQGPQAESAVREFISKQIPAETK